ncbi:FAD-binding oxidoreductase [Sciscionella sediminilitoris]|uniref:FAD-binding oxidoreductase n=1 Tax=Sciscionella sediminilitoris TaxID=1445613 RepID=UPI0009E75B32|nr:FAD-binding oxidoreductase [Sciscionella sp. SE31]
MGMRALLREHMPELETAFEGEENYAEAKAAWNILTRYSPAGVVQPRTTAEVQQILRLAAEAGVDQIAIRSGGHSFEGGSLGGPDGHALVIDMIKMNRIDIDVQGRTAVVEGGALLGQLYLAAYENGGLMAPMGSCVSVGVGGQAQCGGYGHYARTFGILTDRVRQFEVVTADGTVRIANAVENPDLYWALRGNGTGSFGVITKLWITLNPAPKAPANFELRYALSDIDFDSVFTAIQDYTLAAPVTVNPMVIVWLGYLEVAGSIMTDSPQEREAAIADLKAKLPAPTTEVIEPMSFLESVRDLGLRQTSAPWYQRLENIHREGQEHSRFMKIKAGFVPEKFGPEFIHAFGELAATQPTTGVRVQLLAMDPEHDRDAEDTAIKNRGCPWLMGMSVWIESEDDDNEASDAGTARLPWLNDCYELFYPVTTGGYIGDDDRHEADNGRDLFASYYGANFGRLKEIKRAYDPRNVFHHPLSIPVD